MHPPKALLTLTAAAVLGAAGGAAVIGIAGDGGHTATTTIETTREPAVKVADRSNGTLTAGEVYRHAKDSVAYISAQVTQADDSTGGEQQGEATGTGFVVSKEGLIVTNAHVVEGATAIDVKVGDGASHSATVVGRDESSDVALLRVDTGGQTLTPLKLADSGKLAVGDTTYAIGNPYGLDRTLTAGVVSALNRQITAPNGYTISGVIQTDAPINPGNSGGPLLDDQGDVIGLNSQILNGSGSSETGNVGIGFALPSSKLRAVVRALETDGHVAHAYLGVQMTESESGDGAQVAAVSPDTPAADAGVETGDVIVALDGTKVDGPDTLAGAISGHQPGDAVRVTVSRDGAQRTIDVTLGTQPQQATTGTEQSEQQQAPQQADPYGQEDPQQTPDSEDSPWSLIP